jgi:predicted XRE-type DNA-binding protein
MKVTIDLRDEVVDELNKHVGYYAMKQRLSSKDDEASIEDVIRGALQMYLRWVSLEPSPLIQTDDLKINSRIVEMFESQKRSQKEVWEQTGIPRSTINGIWNGSVPSLESFIRLWIALGEPPVQLLLDVE